MRERRKTRLSLDRAFVSAPFSFCFSHLTCFIWREKGLRLQNSQKTTHGDLFDISAFSLVIERDTRNWCETERKSPDS